MKATTVMRAQTDPLIRLAGAAGAETLEALVLDLAASEPSIRRQCLAFLKAKVKLPKTESAAVLAAELMALWDELESDLAELDEYGGGYRETEDNVDTLLYELAERLEKEAAALAREDRRAFIEAAVPYIESGNAGMDDALINVTYAACADDPDLCHLAETFEQMGKGWPCDHARRIYRRIGNFGKYLELRCKDLTYGNDYHDLATFYQENGDMEQALATARKGLAEGTGAKDDLRVFLADYARSVGDRKGYLELQFARTAERLSLSSYQAFKQDCIADEWAAYEPRLLTVLAKCHPETALPIRMLREEHEQAVKLLLQLGYPDDHPILFSRGQLLDTARRLEAQFPEQLLKFYLDGLGNENFNAPRQVYACRAEAASNVRRVLVEIMQEPDIWRSIARRLKQSNHRRPAFQDEFRKRLPDWDRL